MGWGMGWWVVGDGVVGGWGMGWWVVGGAPTHVHMHVHIHTHAHTCMYGKHDNFMQMATPIGESLGIHYDVICMCTCVTVAGWWAGNIRFTFVLAGVRSDRCTHWVVTATWSSVTVMNTISTLMGGHALASPKGGGPCSLGTFNYGVVSHLAFRLT